MRFVICDEESEYITNFYLQDIDKDLINHIIELINRSIYRYEKIYVATNLCKKNKINLLLSYCYLFQFERNLHKEQFYPIGNKLKYKLKICKIENKFLKTLNKNLNNSHAPYLLGKYYYIKKDFINMKLCYKLGIKLKNYFCCFKMFEYYSFNSPFKPKINKIIKYHHICNELSLNSNYVYTWINAFKNFII